MRSTNGYGLGDAHVCSTRGRDGGDRRRRRRGRRPLHARTRPPLHPARLARGLAVAVERLGGVVHEQTAVSAIAPGRVRTDHGTVRAPVVVRATEAYTPSIEGHERDLLPLGNYMVATEPIDDDTWAQIGLARRELFEDGAVHARLRPAHRRRAHRLGRRSGPSWWGSRVPPSPMRDERVRPAAPAGPRASCSRCWPA